MFTADQHRAKAAQYRGFLDIQRSPSETSEFRNLEQTHTTLADNEEWLARNAEKILPASQYHMAPTSKDDQRRLDVFVKEDEMALRCFGAAVVMQWSNLPAMLQREFFDCASSLDDFDRNSPVSDLVHTHRLKEQIARLLHNHNGAPAEMRQLGR